MAVATYVGSFAKATATGNQDITIPIDLTAAGSGTWAVVFWGAGSASGPGTWVASAGAIQPMIGFVANGGGSLSQYAVGTMILDVSATTDTQHRMASACYTVPDWPTASTAVDEAQFVSFNTSTTMRLNWTVNGTGVAAQVNYMIITGLTGAKAINWSISPSVGLK